jgi:hypothetical protein
MRDDALGRCQRAGKQHGDQNSVHPISHRNSLENWSDFLRQALVLRRKAGVQVTERRR